VQCGAFADEANAKRLSERLIEIGYPAYVAVAADKKLYRVMISTPRSRQEAEQMVAELTNWGYPARVVRN
jgi:cell division protein FtsN